ncbi:MAG TPA: ABC transporter permease [Pyrinomonadaceae bacterium]|jgi:lipopolysaccharide transport system permease protein
MGLTTSEGPSASVSDAPAQAITRPTGKLLTFDAVPLPDKPLIIIERSHSWNAINLQELWAYRELLYFLTLRDIKVRYKQTLLGAAWAIIQPLLTMLIFTLFFGRLAGLENRTGGIPYPIFSFVGLLPWTFFANAVTSSSNSLVNSVHLVTKIYFPRMIIPAAAVAAGLVDFALGFIILAILMAYYGVAITSSLFWLPLVIGLLVILALGIGMFLAALQVKFRDIRHALPFVVQIWMFTSPVIFPTSLIPDKWRWLLALNPMSGIIEGFRAILLGRVIDWNLLGVSAAISLVLLISSGYAFRRMERSFADVI